jgi:hypothetical protein
MLEFLATHLSALPPWNEGSLKDHLDRIRTRALAYVERRGETSNTYRGRCVCVCVRVCVFACVCDKTKRDEF